MVNDPTAAAALHRHGRYCRHCGRPVHLAQLRGHDNAAPKNEWVHTQPGAWIVCPGPRADPAPRHPDEVRATEG